MNFFTLNDQLAFVDLPGYGYAQVPEAVRKEWGPMVENYLQNRASLKLVLILFDIRRTPTPEDMQMLEWAAHHGKAVILVLTKIDKVKLNEKKANTQKIIEAFNTENLHHVHYSVPKNMGRKELIRMINEALENEKEALEDEK